MKKIVLVVLTVTMCMGLSQAQVDKSFYNKSYESRNNGTFDKQTNLFSFGLGIPSYYSYSGFNQSPALYGKYEHGFLRDEIGLGGYVAFGWGSYDYIGEDYNFSAFSLAVLGYYHFNKMIPIEKMDVYAGAGLGVRTFSADDAPGGGDYDESGVIFVVKIGIRYYVVKNFAVYAETGYDDLSSVNFGGSFRF
ncbi:MAG TPA: hypothetical protein VFZ52_01515 [Chryseolinea sp.]